MVRSRARRAARRGVAGTGVLALALLLAAAPALGQGIDLEKRGQAGMAFLKLGVGARPAGMGGSFVSRQADALSIFWNPAGLAAVEGAAASFNNMQWISDIDQHAVGAAASLGRWGVVGVSVVFMDYGTLHGTTIGTGGAGGGFEYEDTGTFTVSEHAVGLAYAYTVTDRFSVGAHVRRAASALGASTISFGGAEQDVDNDASVLAFDVGTVYRTGFNDLAFAMSVRNISQQVAFPHMFEDFQLPLVYTLGVSMDVLQAFTETDGVQRMVVHLDGIHPNDGVERFNAGLEYSLQDRFFLRGGFKFRDDLETFSGGLGYRFDLGAAALQLDYAATNVRYFDIVHRFTLSVGR